MLAMILANIGGQMVYSLLSVFLVQEMGASVNQVGLLFSIAAILPIMLQIFGGWLSDTIGRLRTIAIGSSVAVFGYLLIFIAPSWEWVLVGLSLEYVAGAFVAPSFSAFIAEESGEEERGRVFGFTRSIYMVVAIIGPALAGLIAYRASFRWMFLVALILYATATVLRVWMALAVQFAPVKGAEKPTLSGLKIQLLALFSMLFAGGVLTWIWVTDAINDVAFNMIGQLYPIYLTEIGGMNVEQAGLLNATWGVASIMVALLAGFLTDRFSERAVISVGFGLQALGLFVLTQVNTFSGFFLAVLIFGFGAGSLSPAYDTLVSKVVPEDKRGIAFGMFGTSLGILSLPFPWIGAQLWERFNPLVPFWVTLAATLVSIPIVLVKFKPAAQEPMESVV